MAKPVEPQEIFELWQKMVNPGAFPLQSLMFPVLDAKEIERKISELAVVEHWLRANLHMLQLSIKSLEYQRALAASGEKVRASMEKKGTPGEPPPMPDPAAWWNLMAQAGKDMAQAGQEFAQAGQEVMAAQARAAAGEPKRAPRKRRKPAA